MKATQKLHELGQSVWLDDISRDPTDQRHFQALHRRLVADGTYIEPDNLRSGYSVCSVKTEVLKKAS